MENKSWKLGHSFSAEPRTGSLNRWRMAEQKIKKSTSAKIKMDKISNEPAEHVHIVSGWSWTTFASLLTIHDRIGSQFCLGSPICRSFFFSKSRLVPPVDTCPQKWVSPLPNSPPPRPSLPSGCAEIWPTTHGINKMDTNFCQLVFVACKRNGYTDNETKWNVAI